MKRMLIAVGILAVVGGLSFAGDNNTLSGTFTNSMVDDGTTGYIKLMAEGGDCMEPGPGAHAAMASFAEGKASYAIEGVADGVYTACAFIDVNAQDGQVNADSGDYGAMLGVTVEGDTTFDIEEGAWMQIP